MTHGNAFAGLILCCAVWATGCPSDMCTLIGCGESLAIVISHGDGGDLEGGEYIVEVRFDGEVADTLTCVPGGTNECDATPGAGILTGTMDATSIDLSYGDSGDELPGAIQITVSFAGETLGAQSFEPSWSVDYPNGEECEPACWTADDEELEIDRPN